MECQHEWRKYRKIYGGKGILRLIKEGVLRFRPLADCVIEIEITENAKKGRGILAATMRKCKRCGKREIMDGNLASGGWEYLVDPDGTLGMGYKV
jgi:hypothetical protein